MIMSLEEYTRNFMTEAKKYILNSYYKTPKVPKSPFFSVRSLYHYSPLPYVYLFIFVDIRSHLCATRIFQVKVLTSFTTKLLNTSNLCRLTDPYVILEEEKK